MFEAWKKGSWAIEVDATPVERCAAVPSWVRPIDVDAAPAASRGPLRVTVPAGAPVVVRSGRGR